MEQRRRKGHRERPDSPQKPTGGRGEKDGTAAPPELPYQRGVSPDDVDITGPPLEGVRIDPDATEEHPGYEESGGSEIIPPRP
jgi:hypothetical protein